MNLLDSDNTDDDLKLAQYELTAAAVWMQANKKLFPARIQEIIQKLIKKEILRLSKITE